MNATLRSPPRQATGSVLRQLWAVSAFFTRPAAIIRTYPRNALPRDLVAGLTVALVVLPQAIAYALIAELPPQMGLYAAIVGSIVGALWGSSHHLQTGPTNAASLLVLSVLLTISTPGTPDYLIVAGMMALLVGIFRLVIGLARLGILVNFVSDSVIVGFTAGAGLLIFLNQLRNLLRLNVASTPALGETLQGVVTHLDETHVPSLALGVGAILIILLLRRLSRRLPGPLIAMVATSFAVGLLGLGNQGVKVIGQLPRGLPPLTPLPLLELELIGKLSTGALAVAGIGLVEAMSIARSIASKTGQRLDSNQEFVGQGLANIACGFLSGYTCSGSFTRSAVNFEAGALTSLSSVFCGLFVLAAVLGLAPLAAYIPLSALAGVLAVTAYSLIDRRSMARIWRGGGGDRVIMVVTLLATLLLPLQFAVLTGILMSLAYYLLQTSTPQVRPVLPNDTFTHFVYRPDKPPCPQLGIIEILGDLYFGAVHHIEESIQENSDRNPSQRFLLLRMHSIEHCDVSGIHALEHIARTYREHGGDLYLTRVGESVMEIMRATGFDQFLGADHLLREDEAVSFLFHRVLDPAICIYECPARAFKECQNLPKSLHPLDIQFPAALSLDGIPTITPQALWQALRGKTPPLVIDVREPREFKQGHVPEARSIPLPSLLSNFERIPREGAVVLVCRGGRRSVRATSLLRREGYGNVTALQGGMLAWEKTALLEAVDEPVE